MRFHKWSLALHKQKAERELILGRYPFVFRGGKILKVCDT